MFTCIEIKTTKILCMTTHEVSKDDLQIAIIASSQNIIHLNIQS